MFEREIRDFSTIKRWGTLRTIQTQNMAEHVAYVAIYAERLYYLLKDEYRRQGMGELLAYCLWHDAPETFSGDLPGPWKREVTDVEKYGETETKYLNQRFPGWPWERPENRVTRQLVKVANLVDEMMFLSIEISLGNAPARAVRDGSVMVRLKEAITNYDLFRDDDYVLREILSDAVLHEKTNSRFLHG